MGGVWGGGDSSSNNNDQGGGKTRITVTLAALLAAMFTPVQLPLPQQALFPGAPVAQRSLFMPGVALPSPLPAPAILQPSTTTIDSCLLQSVLAQNERLLKENFALLGWRRGAGRPEKRSSAEPPWETRN